MHHVKPGPKPPVTSACFNATNIKEYGYSTGHSRATLPDIEEKRERRGERRGERREGGRERREENRKERREEREKRERRGERRGEERRGEREERRGEERGEKREERGERRERRGERMNPDLNFLIGVTRRVLLSLRCTCHVSAFGFVDPIRFAFHLCVEYAGARGLREAQRLTAP